MFRFIISTVTVHMILIILSPNRNSYTVFMTSNVRPRSPNVEITRPNGEKVEHKVKYRQCMHLYNTINDQLSVTLCMETFLSDMKRRAVSPQQLSFLYFLFLYFIAAHAYKLVKFVARHAIQCTAKFDSNMYCPVYNRLSLRNCLFLI